MGASVTIEPATLRDLTFIAANLRMEDVEEVQAFIGPFDPVDLAFRAFYGSGPENAFVARLDGVPCAALGAAPGGSPQAHVWQAWCWGSPRLPRAVPAITRWMRDVGRPLYEARGCVRMECRSLATHRLSGRWLPKTGATLEGRLRRYGHAGEDFLLWSWLRGE